MGNSNSKSDGDTYNDIGDSNQKDIIIHTPFTPHSSAIDPLNYRLTGTAIVTCKRTLPRNIHVEFETRQHSRIFPELDGDSIVYDRRSIDIILDDELCAALDECMIKLKNSRCNESTYGRLEFEREHQCTYGYVWPRNTDMWTYVGPMNVEGEPQWKLEDSIDGLLPGWTVSSCDGKSNLLLHLKALALCVGRLSKNDRDVRSGSIRIISW